MILRFHDEGTEGVVDGTLSSRPPFQGFHTPPSMSFTLSLASFGRRLLTTYSGVTIPRFLFSWKPFFYIWLFGEYTRTISSSLGIVSDRESRNI